MNLINTQWAYLAGIMDGEGSFSIARGGRKPSYGHPKGYINYQLKISIGNTNDDLHDWLIENVGGAKYIGHRSKTDKQKHGHNWQLHGKDNQKELILGVLPYLVLKKKQALLALEMLTLDGKQPTSRQVLWLRMKMLNRKGKTVETNTPNIQAELERCSLESYQRTPEFFNLPD